MKIVMLPLTLLSALALTACGGGSSSSSTPPPATPSKLAAYPGTWVGSCTDHEVETLTVVATATDTITVAPKSEYYSLSNCTGAVVATLTRSAVYVMVHESTVDASVVFSSGAGGVTSKVNLVTLTSPAVTLSVTGTGAVHTTRNGRPQWCMDFADSTVTCVDDEGVQPAGRRTEFPLHIGGNKWYFLNANGAVYDIFDTYTKR